MRTGEELAAWILGHDGIAPVSAFMAAGFTTHGIRNALRAGVLERVKRGWVAVPGCDVDLRRAVVAGGRITCLSAARRRGLWTPEHDRLHIVVPPTASRVDAAGLHLHWGRAPMPTAAPALEDPIANVLLHVARCVPPPDALAVWESAIRKGCVTADVLKRIEWRSGRARELAKVASSLSDSGVETRFLVLMKKLGIIVRQQVSLEGHRVDGLIGDRLVVQLDGFAHHQASERRRDIAHDARLTLCGYTVMRFDYVQVLFQPEHVMSVVAHAVAQGLHLAR
jgi:very-short-patch-repair endonuclease